MLKSKLPLAVGFLILLAPAWSAEISLASYSASAGSSVPAAISFAAQGAAVSAVQFDLEYDSSVMSLVLLLAPSAKDSQKLLYTADLGVNKKRVIVIGPNSNLLYSDTLVSAFVNLKTTAPAGTYPLKVSQVICSDPDGRSVVVTGISGSIVVQPSAPVASIRQEGVLNGASLRSGPIAPGEIITLIGSSIGPAIFATNQGNTIGTVLGETRLLFDNIPAPLLYASSGQINAVVPFGVAGTSAKLVIETKGQNSAELTLPVTAAIPGIFTLDSSGLGPGAILNEDSSVNTPANPASRGSVVSLFATGAGQMDPPGTDAQIGDESALGRPVLPVFVQVGTTPAELLYAGTAPGQVSGSLQVNFRIPDSIGPSFGTPVSIQVGSVRSQTGVTIAIK